MAASRAGDDPAGNNGTVKIDGLPNDSAPDNEPHVGCAFDIGADTKTKVFWVQGCSGSGGSGS